MATKTDFEEIYVKYYAKMKRFALEYVVLEEDAENIIHDVFTELWERWDTYSTHTNLLAFLFLILKNKCIDFLRHKQTQQKAIDKIQEEYRLTLQTNYLILEHFELNMFSENDLSEIINKALLSLPERCREIFMKNKLEGKKQKQIAEELGISVNTVENHMANAYKILREELKHVVPLLLFLIS